MAITQRRMTLKKFLELPEDEPALECAEGAQTSRRPASAASSAPVS